MSALSSEQLKEQITSVPNELQKALEQQAKARMAVAHLETQISKLESEIERVASKKMMLTILIMMDLKIILNW